MTLPGFVPRPSQDTTDEIAKLWRVIRGMQKTSGSSKGWVTEQDTTSSTTIPATTETLINQVTFTAVPNFKYRVDFQGVVDATGAGVMYWNLYVLLAPLGGNANDPGSIGFFGTQTTVPATLDSPYLFKVVPFPLSGPCTLGITAYADGTAGSTIIGARSLLVTAI